MEFVEIRKMKIFLQFLLLLYFVLPQLVLGANEKVEKHLTPRIVEGDAFERGDFPWMVALTRNVTNQAPDFFGAGTLVSSRHVIMGND